MSGGARRFELIIGPFRASWRAGLGWAIAFILIIVSTVAFWPAFKGSTALNEAMRALPQGMLQAFGLQDFASPAGYLRGGLYDVLVPLMFAAAGAMFANGATAAEEEAGRLELVLAQPVTRRALMTGRAISTGAWLAVICALVLASQMVSDAAFDLQIPTVRIVSTVVLAGLLGAFYAGLAFALAGIVARPGVVLFVALAAALVGYLVSALFPLSDVLASWARISPWDWALGDDPLIHAAEPWRYVALALPAAALVVVGIVAFDRRDIRSA